MHEAGAVSAQRMQTREATMNERTIQARTPLAASTSRRGALRLLPGFALAGSSMAALTGDGNARSTNKE